MKNITAASAVLAVLICAGQEAFANAQEPSVQDIRRHYNQINRSLRNYSRVDRDLVGHSSEGGDLSAYFSGRSPRKIETRLFGCRHQSHTEYYFRNGRLAFVYNVRLGDTGVYERRILSRRDERFYFSGGRLIRWLGSDKKPLSTSSPQARRQERELLQDARRWLRLALQPARRER
jgi:hypothetical protein